MSTAAPPLRFLGVVLGGWVCARVAILAPDWLTEEVEASELPRPPAPSASLTQQPRRGERADATVAEPVPELPAKFVATPAVAPPQEEEPPPKLALSFAGGGLEVVPLASQVAPVATTEAPAAQQQSLPAALQSAPARLSVSGWAIIREGSEARLAPGGLLGGSQAGLRATYQLTETIALSGRLSSPLKSDGAEAALGIEWQPSRSVPVKLLAERRQAIGEEGRSAFALVAHGGVSEVKVAGPVTADAYVQAGVVGTKQRDLFADGAVKLNVPVTPAVSVGAGAWGAAQPDISRLDVGPHVTLTLPGGDAVVKVSAEWRVRVAGDAEPGSGPAVTVSTSF